MPRVRPGVSIAIACAVLAGCAQQPAPTPTAQAHGWTLVAHTRVGQTPGPVTLGGRWAFVANMSDGTVSELDASSGRVEAVVKVADPHVLRAQGCAPDSVHAYYSGSWGWRLCDTPYAIGWDGSALWALDDGDRQLVKVDPAKHAVTERIDLPGTGWSVAFHAGSAYVSGFADNHALYVVDLSSRKVTTVDNLDTGPATLTADASGVWVACVRAGTGHLDRYDPAAGAVTARYEIEWWSTAVTAEGGSVYVRGTFGGDISKVDPSSGATVWSQPGPGFVGRQGVDELGPSASGIWMSGPTTALVDLGSGEIVDRIRVPSASVAAAGGDVWMVELDGSIAKFEMR